MGKPYILIAEDDDDQRELYTQMLEMEGFKVNSVASGKEVLEVLQQSHPDVILTDIGMPEMDGLELIRRVKEQLADIPVVVMTSFQKGYLTLARAAGASGTITKPFSAEDLYTAILEVLPPQQNINKLVSPH